jgi:hypothetical protein
MYAFAFSMDPSVLEAKTLLLEKTLTVQSQIALQRAGDAVRTSLTSDKYFQNHTNKTAGSFSLVRSGEMGMAVRSRAKVAFFLDQGTKPHIIRPKAAKGFVGPLPQGQSRGHRANARQVLAFQIGGRTIFRRQVNHPGTKAKHFVEAEEQRLRFELLPQLGDEAARRAIADAGLS